jgi:virulence factor Mce-like protein
MNARSLITIVAVAVLSIVGLAYLTFGVVGYDPFDRPLLMTVNLDRSGGLLLTSPVTYRGVQVGKVTDIALRPGGVRVSVRVDGDTRIPADTEVAVANLSAAGEQYLDFRPRTDSGPFLTTGAVVDPKNTRTPVPFPEVVSNVTQLVSEIDPSKINVLVHEAQLAFNGTAPDIRRIVDGGTYLLNGLTGVLPQTINILHNGGTTLATVSDLSGHITGLSGSAKHLTRTVRGADGTIRDVLDQAPGTLGRVDDVVRENSSRAGSLVGNLVDVTDVVSDRLPAISQFLPLMTKLGPALNSVIYNGTVNVLVDLYPRPVCDYGTPRRAPQLGGSPLTRIHRYCTTTGPRLQQRGAQYAPRPRGDHTDRASRGTHPEDRAGPLPERNGNR